MFSNLKAVAFISRSKMVSQIEDRNASICQRAFITGLILIN